LAAAAGLYALGVASGEFLLELTDAKVRKLGRALKITSQGCAGYFAIFGTLWPSGFLGSKTPWDLFFSVGVLYILGCGAMYVLEAEGVVRHIEEPAIERPNEPEGR
jgi:hypothetical protein